MLTPVQSRTGRDLLGWSAADLAGAAGLGANIVEALERGASTDGADRLRAALEQAGVEFLDEDGAGSAARLRQHPRSEGLRPDELTTDNDK